MSFSILKGERRQIMFFWNIRKLSYIFFEENRPEQNCSLSNSTKKRTELKLRSVVIVISDLSRKNIYK